MRDLSGTAALVTGGASGLGLATAQALAAAGARVAALDLSRDITTREGILAVSCDVTEEMRHETSIVERCPRALAPP